MTRYKPDEISSMIDALDLKPVLDDQVRQVKWLYNNSNKRTMVYDEKLVRLIVQRLEHKITYLNELLEKQYEV